MLNIDSERSVTPEDIALDATAGDAVVIATEVAVWAGRPSREALTAIARRISQLKQVEPATYGSPHRGPRASSDLLQDKALIWGCSAQAQVACHLCRASGIPAIVVKSLEREWFQGPTSAREAKGHVYLEVLVDGAIQTWNPGTDRFVDSVNPDGRVVYDKGAPDSIILSHHGSAWEEETEEIARGLRQHVSNYVRDLLARSQDTLAMAAKYRGRPFPEA